MTNDWRDWKPNVNEKVDEEKLIGRKFIYFSIFFILIIIISNLKIIEVLSLADGKIIPQGRIKFVQHLEGGIVEEILIKEGQKVETSQPLVILSKEKASSEFEEINSRLKSINLSILRVNSEKEKLNNIIIPDRMKNLFDNDLIKFENELLKSRKKAIDSERKSKVSNIDKSKQNLINLKKRLKIVKEQESISEKLLKAEATNRLRHLELLRELSDVESKIDEQKSLILFNENELEKVNNNYDEQLNQELSALKKEKEELNKRIQKYSDSLNRTVLKSPVTGIVKLISVNSKGAIVAPGVTVVEIVPDNEKLIVEAKLPLSEIGYISNGLDAKIRLNTPEGSRFRALEGEVVFVGADRISISDKNEESYYLVKIETKETSFSKKDENFELFSGVPVIVGNNHR